MKRTIAKTAAFVLAVSMALGLAACGDSGSSSKSDTGTVSTAASDTSAAADSKPADDGSVSGAAQTWGIYTVLVPEGWKLKGGDFFDENDPNFCSVKKSDFSYFDFKSEKEETQKSQYEYNKKTYTSEQKDLPAATIAGIEWNGFEYGSEITKGFELYGQYNGRFLRVSSAGFAFDSKEAKAILESLKISDAAGSDESAPAESTADSTPAESTADSTAAAADGSREPEVPATASFAEKTKFKFNGAAFSVGDKFADIKDKLGKEAKPSAKSQPCVPGSQEVENFYYPGLSFQVNYEGTIINMSISEDDAPGRDASTAGGLKLGDTRETAKKFLGDPASEDEYSLKYVEGEVTMTIYDRENQGIFLISIEDHSLPF